MLLRPQADRQQRENEGQEFVKRDDKQVIVAGLAAPLDRLLFQPVAEGADDARGPPAEICEDRRVEHEEYAVEDNRRNYPAPVCPTTDRPEWTPPKAMIRKNPGSDDARLGKRTPADAVAQPADQNLQALTCSPAPR